MPATQKFDNYSIEHLPFVVQVEKDLATAGSEIGKIRAEAYSRHDYKPALQGAIGVLDHSDEQSAVLVARHKETGAVLGTVRVRCSRSSDIALPPGMDIREVSNAPFAYLDRFAVEQGTGASAVTRALSKASAYWTYLEGAEWMLAAALRPLIRVYRQMGLRVLEGAENGFHIESAHHALYFAIGERVESLYRCIEERAPSHHDFYFKKHHPDIFPGGHKELRELPPLAEFIRGAP